VARECDQALQEVHDLPQSTFGLETYVERLETLLTSERSDAAPRYVGVWGMGGVGKTLLLQTLYGSPKVKGHFQGAMFIWLTVGQTPDIMALYRTLSKKLGLDPELYVHPEDYKRYLHTAFIQKRVFLVLDDVWRDKAFDSLELAKGKGSVTLLSTRNQSLLERASPQMSQEHMTPLSKEDSWSLFCVHAFRSPSNVPCELKALAQSMAEECQGLALALKVIGRAMFGKTSPELQWAPLLKKLRESRMQERTVEEELYERLKLGYDLLSEADWRLKDCFLFFAAFREDYEIFFEETLWYWIGEGLVSGNGEDDATADAFSLLNKLCERSFIDSIGEIDSAEGNDLHFKVHDVMRDLAFYILEKDCGAPPAKELYFYRAGQNLEEIPQEGKGMQKALKLSSLQCRKLQKLPESFYAPELVSLILCLNSIQFVPESFLSNIPKLRVLDLSFGSVTRLPEELGNLKHLVFLNLRYCERLEILPDSIGKLHALKCLDVSYCSLSYLPSSVVDLTSLQELHTRGCYLLWDPDARAQYWGQDPPEFVSTIGASLEDICGLIVLTKLSVSGIYQLPHNINGLTKLKNLELSFVETLPHEMGHALKQLKRLELECWNLKYLPRSFTCGGAFPALICLNFNDCVNLVEFPEVDEGALPKLQTLHFDGCGSLKRLPLSLEFLTSLKNLRLSGCSQKTLEHCYWRNCEKSLVWRTFNIIHPPWPVDNSRGSQSVAPQPPVRPVDNVRASQNRPSIPATPMSYLDKEKGQRYGIKLFGIWI
jgi:hypothetical protein